MAAASSFYHTDIMHHMMTIKEILCCSPCSFVLDASYCFAFHVSSSVFHTHAAFSLMRSVFVKAFADSVSSQKRAAADGECREECLLQETATKEAAMATRMEEVQAELKQSRLALGNADAEIERLGVFSSQLKKVLRLLLRKQEQLHLASSKSLLLCALVCWGFLFCLPPIHLFCSMIMFID